MAKTAADTRPISPHLQIWRPTPTMAASITHRATGMALYSGTLLLAIWLIAAAAGEDAFNAVQALYGTPIGLLIFFGYTWALLFHLMNGVRHLIWDTGRGLEPKTATGGAIAIYILSVVFAVVVWVAGFMMQGGA